MTIPIPTEPSAAEQQLLRVVRRLPPEHVAAVLDFAEFLAAKRANGADEEEPLEDEASAEADEAKWDALLARPEAQRMLEQLADEAREDYLAGRTTDIVITDDGELAPA